MKKTKKNYTEYYFDYSLLFIVLFLVGFGLMMIYSVSSYEAYANYGNEAFFLIKQLRSVIIGLIGMAVVTFVPYHWYEKLYGWGYLVSCVLLALVPFIGIESHGVKRWLPLPGGFQFQPAEIAKIAVILFCATMICKMGKGARKLGGNALLLIASAVMALMVYFCTSNLSSAIIVLGIGVVMIFIENRNYSVFVIFAVLAVVAIVAFVMYMKNVGMEDGLSWRFERIVAWLDPEAHSQGKGFQTVQALYAIGSGGIWGKGLGQSMQKLGFIPEAQNDMIFSVICEELGLFGGILIIVLFLILLWRMVIIAINAQDLFGSQLVIGVVAQIAIQVILNIAVVTNTI
ncbi:MAG: FtsW/RodA/SpoVE family cell cycle protein, partial [Lachnospiraceae bacterium]|nr:FtsW/RodA/SpoVE family cell cycle protein [Lachnospiraceae bacterium]